MNRIVKLLLVASGLTIGIWYAFLTLQTIFVMRDEWVLLAGLVVGPLSVLPAIVVSIWRPRAAGKWLLAAATAFLVITCTHRGVDGHQVGMSVTKFVLPMVALGVGCIYSGRIPPPPVAPSNEPS